jgi:hypothetical protein
MSDISEHKEYELSEEDIDKAIHILSVFNHKNATPEEAIDFLEWLRTQVHLKAHNLSTEQLVEMYNQVSKKPGGERIKDL